MKTVSAMLKSIVLVIALFIVASAADVPPTLSHNPFSRPSSEVTRDARGVVESDDGNGRALDLQATLVGSVNKLANVAGRVMKPGDEIQGYVLFEVYEEYAVFKKDGRSVTIYVKPQPVDDDE